MLNIRKEKKGSKLNVSLEGKLDTLTAPQLQEELDSCLEGVTELDFDFTDLEYISSAGLRILLTMHKRMAPLGGMTVRNLSEEVAEVFDITGFADTINIQ